MRKNKKIFVAGGSGLVGFNLVKKLKHLNYNVKASYNTQKINNSIFKKYDFLKLKDCLKATKNKDIVYICAVKGSGIKNLENNYFNENINNLKIRLNLLESCRINKVKKIIWVSSSTVYQPKNKPISEKEIDFNLNPYDIYMGVGWSYRYIEKVAEYYQNKFKMNISIIRTTSIYGPYDNFDIERSHVIPALIVKCLDKSKNLKVWGNKNVVRDFVYVGDLVDAIIKIIDTKKMREPINFSSGEATSILKLAELILNICGKKKNFLY